MTTVRIGEARVEHGGCLAVVGPNGSGKTRLLLQLAGRLQSPPGELEVLEAVPGARTRRHRVSLLTDDAGLGARSFAQAVRWTNALRGDPHAPIPEELAAGVDLDRSLVDRRWEECSRGERRLMTLALALAPPVAVALLDEPLSGLDPPHYEAVERYVHRRRDEGLTVVCTSPYEAPGWPDKQVLYLP